VLPNGLDDPFREASKSSGQDEISLGCAHLDISKSQKTGRRFILR